MDHCCASGAPVSAEYAPQGVLEKVGDMDVYITGSGTAGVVAVYDIFGFEFPQVKQVADRLSVAAGIQVAVPDTFRGKPWSMAKFPPGPDDDLMGWINTAGAFDRVIKDVVVAADLLRGRGVTTLGTLGFCWGAAIALQAAGPDSGLSVAAAGLAHPTLLGRDAELAAGATCPVALLAAKGDPLESVKEVIDAKPELAAKSVYRRFDDQSHGFLAARGDFADPVVAAGATEGIQLLASFYKSTLC